MVGTVAFVITRSSGRNEQAQSVVPNSTLGWLTQKQILEQMGGPPPLREQHGEKARYEYSVKRTGAPDGSYRRAQAANVFEA